MAFPIPVAAAMAGNSVGQLAYWRKTGLLRPEIRSTRPILYSFRDVVALRTVAYLRDDSSLQQVRFALTQLRDYGGVDHLSSYKVVQAGRSIAWIKDDETLDLLDKPGQPVLANMVDVLASFDNRDNITVPNMSRPRANLSVTANVRGGFPVIAETRVPFDLVASLVADGVPVDEVQAFYPRVTAVAAEDAADFSVYVDRVAGSQVA